MQTKLKGFWEKIKGFFAKLNKKTRILLAVCAAVLVVLIIAAALLLNRKEYALLYKGLNTSETTTVTQYLRDNQVDFRIEGDAVYVPAGRELQIQVELAQGGYFTTGFNYDYYTEHISSFSTSAERIEATRIATVQKLEAAIRLMDGVRNAVVDITPGTQQVYVLQDSVSEGTAWVTVETESTQPLSDGVVQAIRNMVVHSDASLNIGSVTIQDLHGNTYNDTSSGIGQSADANALKLQYEQETNNKIRAQVMQALGSIYGEDNVKVAVNTTVDMNRKVVETTQYSQPEGSAAGRGLIGTEKYFWELTTDGNITVGGAVGTTTNSQVPDIDTYPNIEGNLNGDNNAAAGEGQLDYSIDTEVTQQEVIAGTITDVGVAVTINQNAQNAGSVSVADLTHHIATISNIGSEDPDSRVSILIAPFDQTSPGGSNGPNTIIPGVENWVLFAALGGLVLFLVLLLIILLLARRSKKKKLAKQQALEEEMRAAEAAAEAAAIIAAAPPTGGADIMEVNTEKSMELRKSVRQFAQNNPEIAAQMVKAWLKGDESGG